jgi:hypothetical protein
MARELGSAQATISSAQPNTIPTRRSFHAHGSLLLVQPILVTSFSDTFAAFTPLGNDAFMFMAA